MNDVTVSCYSGYAYPERPQTFRWAGRNYEIEEIERAWLEPRKRYFQVHTRDNKMFRLCYDEVAKQWSVTEFVL